VTEATTYFMSKFFLEPRALISLSPGDLQASIEFNEALQVLKSNVSGYSVADLFAEFGTHVCANAELGGWWKVAAHYKSTEQKSSVAMAAITGTAIGQTVADSKSKSASLGYKAPGNSTASASAGISKSSSSSSAGSSAEQEGKLADKSEANSAFDLSIKQEWKGGTSSVGQQAWLQSLEPEHNSNWKIVDRRMPLCTGIWQWAVDEAVRQDICGQFLSKFLLDMGVTSWNSSVQEDLCSGAADPVALKQCRLGGRGPGRVEAASPWGPRRALLWLAGSGGGPCRCIYCWLGGCNHRAHK